MFCLCCGKPIAENATEIERQTLWHAKCVHSFFGTKALPEIDISDKILQQLAKRTVKAGATVAGVQKKLSLHLSSEDPSRLTIVDYPYGYILKPQSEDYAELPEAEDLCMRLAEIAGIRTVPHALIKLQGGDFAYITKRIDRLISLKTESAEMLAMEDFCQLSGRLTEDKYKGSYERCADIIKKFSTQPGLDLSELFMRVVFSFLSGNSDMHLKNFSIIERAPASRTFTLATAYDLLPVNVIIPADKEQLALTLNGKKRNLRRKDFLIFADSCGIPRKSAEKMLDNILYKKEAYLELCDRAYTSDKFRKKMKKLIEQRVEATG